VRLSSLNPAKCHVSSNVYEKIHMIRHGKEYFFLLMNPTVSCEAEFWCSDAWDAL